jgi:hypothetical protein
MALDGLFGFSRVPPKPPDNENIQLHANWAEGFLTAAAVSAAVVMVALIAVVMGMASP